MPTEDKYGGIVIKSLMIRLMDKNDTETKLSGIYIILCLFCDLLDCPMIYLIVLCLSFYSLSISMGEWQNWQISKMCIAHTYLYQ